MDSLEQHNLGQIEALNQRGGRTLSIVDLMRAGTLTPQMAGYCLWQVSRGGSFLTGAVPGGAGKSTLLADLLSLLPPGERIVTTPDGRSVEEARRQPPAGPTCYLCHEFGSGGYYGYLWGRTVGAFFRLAGTPHGRFAGCLHADDMHETREVLLSPGLGVSGPDFARVGLAAFMSVQRVAPGRATHRVRSVWEADGRGGHRTVFEWDAASDQFRLVTPPPDDPRLAAAQELMSELLAQGPAQFEAVRGRVLEWYASAGPPR